METMKAGKRRASLGTWVSRLAGVKSLRHKVARRLCSRGILRADERKLLLLFKQDIYPEINPATERKIVERLRAAIYTENDRLDPRTVVGSIAAYAGLFEIIAGCLFLTVVLSFIGFFVLMPAELLQIVILYKSIDIAKVTRATDSSGAAAQAVV